MGETEDAELLLGLKRHRGQLPIGHLPPIHLDIGYTGPNTADPTNLQDGEFYITYVVVVGEIDPDPSIKPKFYVRTVYLTRERGYCFNFKFDPEVGFTRGINKDQVNAIVRDTLGRVLTC